MHINILGKNILDKTPDLKLKIVYYTEVKQPPYNSEFIDYENDNFLGLLFCVKEKGFITINEKKYEIKKDQFILCEYHQVSKLESDSNWAFFFFWFYLENTTVPMNNVFNHVLSSTDLTMCHDIISLLHYKNDLMFLKANSCFTTLLTDWLDKSTVIKNEPYKKEIDDCIQFIHSNLDTPLTIDELAMKYHVSKKHFRFLFEKYINISPKQYILIAKLEKAKHFLIFSQESISDIANMLCFASASHLSSSFKAHYGITPTEFKSSQLRKSNI